MTRSFARGEIVRAPQAIRRSRRSTDFPRLLKGVNDDREVTRVQDRRRDTHGSQEGPERKSNPTPQAIARD